MRSAATSVKTPQGTPPAAIAASRAADFSSNLVGKSATTSTRYGSATSLGHRVVLLDRGVLVPQVLLRHHLHVRRQVGQPLLDLARVGPDLVGDEGAVEVGQVHERAEVAADADRVDDREPDLARRQAGQQPEHRRLEHRERGRAALGRCLDQQVGAGGERPERGKAERVGMPSISRASGEIPRAGRRGRAGPSPKRITGGTTRGNVRAGPDRVVPGRAVAVDLALTASSSATACLHPLAPAVGHRAPCGLVASRGSVP